ncbi:TLD domain-containing protein 1 [Zea mays]|uniref:TLD domain-containing protein 1 n=1 Tax=Zea mays TaxID=4577 RepID=A0A3L6GBW2_MAIZE|nr:TLD domain-containing protein 1 [Zea mays]
MGNSQASPASASSSRFVMASRAFPKQELDGLRELFASLAAQSRTGGRAISRPVFLVGTARTFALLNWSWIWIAISNGFASICAGILPGPGAIRRQAVPAGGEGEWRERWGHVRGFDHLQRDGALTRSDLESVLASVHETVFAIKKEAVEVSNNRPFEEFLNSAVFSKDVEGVSGKSMSLSDFRNWCTLLPSLRKFLGNLLMPPDSDSTTGRPGFEVPLLHYPENICTDTLLLNKEYAWHIGGGFSQHEVQEWKLLYHSSLHGQSFNTFLGKVTNGDAQTVLIVKDTEGSIYGGYASQPWERHSDFYGDMKTFLFKCYPQASIFRPTGANKNLQWCAVNFSSENIPNGIGFGGQPHHFGLFLSANFDQGHSFTCSTFTSPPLSKTNRFRPEVIECWGIQMRGAQDEKLELVKGTVLERFKEDRNMLKMVGLANASD